MLNIANLDFKNLLVLLALLKCIGIKHLFTDDNLDGEFDDLLLEFRRDSYAEGIRTTAMLGDHEMLPLANRLQRPILVVREEDEIILSTDKGSIMRCAVKEIRIAGRNTQGVRIKKLSGNEKVVSVIKIEDNIQ